MAFISSRVIGYKWFIKSRALRWKFKLIILLVNDAEAYAIEIRSGNLNAQNSKSSCDKMSHLTASSNLIKQIDLKLNVLKLSPSQKSIVI